MLTLATPAVSHPFKGFAVGKIENDPIELLPLKMRTQGGGIDFITNFNAKALQFLRGANCYR